MDHVWELRNPDGAMLGVEWARGRCEQREVMIAHSLPERVDVVVRDEQDRVVARGSGLSGGEPTPMARLQLEGGSTMGTVQRESFWPTDEDLGALVILPGGEIGVPTAWWNADDGSEWRWQLEFHNQR
ncbi:MAG: DUF7712 family protein [Motilibacteraceae bacterium]